ncbi:cell division protein SepF [Bacillus sp. JJ722]|uniref:cell division protein SepF n=1 Tax=Bacillus sp. JJ722 TaxID=3122973 RepID=UPI002FFDC877
MSIGSKFKSFFALDDEYEYREETQEVEKEAEIPMKSMSKTQPQSTQVPQNVVSLKSVQQNSKMVLVEPRAYSEAQGIADHLNSRRSVVVNLQSISHDQAKRIVDFLSGTVYAIGGDIQRVGTNIFLCTPENVDVSGNISGALQEDDTEGLRW